MSVNDSHHNGTAGGHRRTDTAVQIEQNYSNYHNVKVCCVTFNVGGVSVTPDNTSTYVTQLTSLLHPYLQGGSTDVLMVGLQEICDLNQINNVLYEHSEHIQWTRLLHTVIESSGEYNHCVHAHLVGLYAAVYVKSEWAEYITDIAKLPIYTGYRGLTGNKGAICLSFKLHNTRICCINAHLAAHQQNVNARNNDCHTIVEKCKFVIQPGNSHVERVIGLHHHDVIVLCGDLNYRLTNTDAQHLHDLLTKHQYDKLLEYDQLTQSMNAKLALEAFTESKVTFAPTYKFNVCSTEYSSGNKIGWTDRILFSEPKLTRLINNGTHASHVQQNTYTAHLDTCLSDHKPVVATYTIQIQQIDLARRAAYYDELNRQMDALENSAIPSVAYSPAELSYGELRYKHPVTLQLTVQNTGSTATECYFVAHQTEPTVPYNAKAVYCPPWLTVEKARNVLMPDEQCVIDLTAHIDTAQANELAVSKQSAIDYILILRLRNGRDYFIGASATYHRSSIGIDITWLYSNNVLDNSMMIWNETSGKPQFVPHQYWYCMQYINDTAVDTPHLFDTVVSAEEIDEVIEHVDRNQPLTSPTVTPPAVAGALIHLLRNMPDPLLSLIGLHLHHNSILSAMLHDLLLHLRSQSPVKFTTLKVLIQLLRRLLRHRKHNQLAVEQLQLLFTPLIFGTVFEDVSLSPTMVAQNGKIPKQPIQVKLLEHMLQHDTFELL